MLVDGDNNSLVEKQSLLMILIKKRKHFRGFSPIILIIIFSNIVNFLLKIQDTQLFSGNSDSLVLEPNSEMCLDLNFVPRSCEKVVIVPDTNCIKSAMLDMPSSGSF